MTNQDRSEQGPRPPSLPPGAWSPMVQLVRLAIRPLDHFFKVEAASGILLLAAATVALAWANSPWGTSYTALWHTHLGFHVGSFAFENSLEWFVNDVLMAIFFFTVGMEIRREIFDGELSEWRRAALPAVAALGGMLAPALLYLVLAGASKTHSGWGIPMATDIAFAVGILALLGKRVPAPLRMLLLALAVIDDLGAILVIACFYSSGLAFSGLLVASLGIIGILILRTMGVRQFAAYILPGVVVWVGTYASGIHPTIAGVIVGLLTPVRAWLGAQGFVNEARDQAQRVSERIADANDDARELHEHLQRIDFARREAVSPADYLIDALHPLVAYVIMPLFALANAGVELRGISLRGDTLRASLGIGLALVLGKPLGVVVASVASLETRVSVLPEGLTVRHIVVLGVVAGIGFTMSLFIAQLAFFEPALLGAAKVGVLAGSAVAMVLGLVVGMLLLRLDS